MSQLSFEVMKNFELQAARDEENLFDAYDSLKHMKFKIIGPFNVPKCHFENHMEPKWNCSRDMDILFDKFFSPTKQGETSLIKKLTGSQGFRKDSSIFQNMPTEYQQHFMEESLYSKDFNNTEPPNAFKTNLHNIFRTFNHNMLPHIPKASQLSNSLADQNRLFMNPIDTIVESMSDLNILMNAMPQKTMEKCSPSSDVTSDRSSFSDHLHMSIADAASPNKKAHFNVTISKTVLNPLNTTKKMHKEDCNLTQQMANRKTKEMQKRSKKRRRRQKKSNSSSSKDVQNHKIQVNCASPSDEKKCDIVCDVTVSPSSKSVQIVLPNMSSFVVTIESGDEDSDWDTNSETSWLADDSEFQVSGLFVASFSSTNSCSPLHSELESKVHDLELRVIKAKLLEVNRVWNEQNQCFNAKPKSSTLVSFAADEELEEICPVEMYERKGEWEIFATERLRFKKRISELEEIISPCLLPNHRDKVYSTLHGSVL